MSDGAAVKQYKRIVVKVGTSSLVNSEGRIDQHNVNDLIAQIDAVRRQGTQVILVSSGAIAAGLEVLGYSAKRPEDMPTLQAASAVGQMELVKHYAFTAGMYGIKVSQILLTVNDTSDREGYLHIRDTFNRLLELGALPIVNENDTVSVEEIKYGDNDNLAAVVATLVGADLVVLLSDIEGLYTADPRLDEDAELLSRVTEFTDELVASAGGAGTASGSGGMATKIKAAQVLMRVGIPMVICQGSRPNAVTDIVAGEHVGTMFSTEGEQKAVASKKLWIALGGKPQGVIHIDAGACTALREDGRSLLPVGVKRIEGSFEAGDVVNIRDTDGRLIGRGLARYTSDEAVLAAGKRSDELDRNRTLAHLANLDLIHRDEMILF